MEELRELPRDPWWQVIAVMDDDGRSDFAYTVGLADRGLPELHLWSRPSLGEDPGADWRFSSHDLASLLTTMAWRLVDARLAVGDEWEMPVDAGQVTVRFAVHPPTDAEEVQAYQARGAPVLPVRWSLHREPEGPPAPLSPDQVLRAAAELGAVLDGLPGEPIPLPGWEVPRNPAWSPDERWGPRTALVAARAQSVLQASGGQMISMLNLAFPLTAARATDHAVMAARAAARPVGRSAAVDRLLEDVSALVSELGRSWGHHAWEATLDWINEDDEEPIPEETLAGLLEKVIAPFLVTVAVEDLLPPEVVVHGAGPFVCAMGPDGLPPSEAWHAAPHIVDAVRDLVRGTQPRRLVAAADAWAEVEGDDEAEARGQIAALMVTTPSMFPRWETALPKEFVGHVVRAAPAVVGRADVQAWLSVMTTVLSHRNLLTREVVALVARCGEPHLPGLRRVLDEPMVGGGRVG